MIRGAGDTDIHRIAITAPIDRKKLPDSLFCGSGKLRDFQVEVLTKIRGDDRGPGCSLHDTDPFSDGPIFEKAKHDNMVH